MQRVRERMRGIQVEKAIGERAELTTRRDEARERREQLAIELREVRGESGTRVEDEARELDDEIESLEAQLEVKVRSHRRRAACEGGGVEGGWRRPLLSLTEADSASRPWPRAPLATWPLGRHVPHSPRGL